MNLFGSSAKTRMVTPTDAHPRPRPAPVRGPRDPRGPRHAARGPVPRGLPEPVRRPRLLLGCREALRRVPGVYTTAVGYQGGYSRTRPTRRCAPDAPVTPRTSPWSTTRRRSPDVRPAQGLLGEPRPDLGLPPGQRHRHAVPLGALLDHRRAGRPRQAPGRLRAGARRQGLRPDHHRSSLPPRAGRSTTPSPTTSSTSTRSRTATTATRRPASPSRRSDAPASGRAVRVTAGPDPFHDPGSSGHHGSRGGTDGGSGGGGCLLTSAVLLPC